MKKTLGKDVSRQWVNIGGQLIPETDVDTLRSDIGAGKLASWHDIHKRYDELWQAYPLEKQKHAFAVLNEYYNGLDKNKWFEALNKAITIQEYVSDQVYETRQKDFENPFKQATFRNADEMKAALGTIEDNTFVKQVRSETEDFKKQIAEVIQRS